MNKKQRLRNRATAADLSRQVKHATPCPECGLPCEGGHWITTRHCTLEDMVRADHTGVPLNPDDFGFWTCAKFYEPDTTGPDGEVIPGRRKQEFIHPGMTSGGMMAEVTAVLASLLGDTKARPLGQMLEITTPEGRYDDSWLKKLLDEERTASASEYTHIWLGEPKTATEVEQFTETCRDNLIEQLSQPAGDGSARTT